VADDQLALSLLAEISAIPMIDVHSHIDPLCPTARSLDDLLSYHYYTELAHSCGLGNEPLRADVEPRARCRAILEYAERFDNTVQYSWLVEIARRHLGFVDSRITAADCDALFDRASEKFGRTEWEREIWQATRLECVFLTNAFDDPLEEFDTSRYVPCLRTDDLVFHLDEPKVRERLARTTNIDVGNDSGVGAALRKVFERFVSRGAKACAISLPPDFEPRPGTTFWQLAELCRDFQ
jgi:glucuronate isomerase